MSEKSLLLAHCSDSVVGSRDSFNILPPDNHQCAKFSGLGNALCCGTGVVGT